MKEVATYENQMEKKTDVLPRQSDPNTCEICHKTKFTDGAGKECKYCKLKCCSRCIVEVSIPGAKQVGINQSFRRGFSIKIIFQLKFHVFYKYFPLLPCKIIPLYV